MPYAAQCIIREMVEIIATDDFREWYQDDLDDVAGRAVFEMVAKLEQFGTLAW